MAARKLIAGALRLVPVGILFSMSNAQAAWLHLCPQAQPAADTAAAALFHLPNGERQQLVVDSEPSRAGCRSIALPLPAETIAAVRPLPAPLAASISNEIVLDGSQQRGRLMIGGVGNGREAPSPARVAAPLRTNLLPDMQARTFGAEERAHATLTDGRLALQCRAGRRPAGVVLNLSWYLPQAQLRLQLQVHDGGTGKFDILMADAAQTANETATVIGTLAATVGGRESTLTLPSGGFDRTRWQSVTIACPADAAQLRLDGLRLLPRLSSATAARASWVWQAGAWQQQPDEVLARAAKYGIRLLFISIPVHAGRIDTPDLLAAFIARAAGQGVMVWSVDGDPHMVLPQEHAAAVQRVRAYVAFNASHPKTRIAGFQFDVEPYLLPGYDNASREWEAGYLDLARTLHRAAGGLPLEFVVPFWWGEKTALLHGLAPYASGLSVMDYRTAATEIQRFGVPFLDWGSLHRKRVRIALESGPVEPETRRHYVKAASGELWLLQAEQETVLLLMNEARRNPAGPSFRLVGSTVSDVGAISFAGDAARLQTLLPELETDFAAWDSFAGIALHEIR